MKDRKVSARPDTPHRETVAKGEKSERERERGLGAVRCRKEVEEAWKESEEG